MNHPTWLSELITQIHAEHFHLSQITRAPNEPLVHIMLPLVSETRSCMLTILKHTNVFVIYLPLFCLFLLSFFLSWSMLFISHSLVRLCCLSPCSRGASPTAADESTFLSAFSLSRPTDGPQDQTGGEDLCFFCPQPSYLLSLAVLYLYIYMYLSFVQNDTLSLCSVDVRRAEA